MRAKGFTLVELLLAMVVLLIVISALGAFLSSQSRLSALTNARGNVQDKTRYIAAVLTQDLQLAGASRFVSDSNPPVVSTLPAFGTCLATACLTGTDGTELDSMTTRYITSLRTSADACRQVKWKLNASVLQRSDVVCGGTDSYQDFASGILAFNIVYICSDLKELDTPTCTSASSGGSSFTRSARITVYTQSDQAVKQSSSSSMVIKNSSTSKTVTCPIDRACFGIQQEIEMPNMKDK